MIPSSFFWSTLISDSCWRKFRSLYSTCCYYILSYICVAACSFIIGMLVMTVIFLVYYIHIFPTFPSASLEHTAMYDYLDEDPISMENDVHALKDMDHDDKYFYNAVDNDEDISRNKRNVTLPLGEVSASPGVKIVSPPSTPTGETGNNLGPLGAAQGLTKHLNNSLTTTAIKSKSKFGRTTTVSPTTTESADDYDPDFHLSNTIMDSVFSHAERKNLTQSLGLCRKTADIKVPEFKAAMFPAEEASEILSCINDVLKNHTKKQICVHLDPEMNAYLKWLILTGEPKEKHKPSKVGLKDDFLFPSTPCADEVIPEPTPRCLVEHSFDEHSVNN